MGNGPGSAQQIISVPKGGGAQKGIGETFAPDLHTGTGNFTVPIALPPGRNGLQPALALGYSSGRGNGPYGLGWEIGLPGVSRKTWSGIPVYDDRRDVFILSGAEDLVPVERWPGATRYRPQTEAQFASILHRDNAYGGTWLVRGKDGLLSTYGTEPPGDAGADWSDPAAIANPEDRTRVFAWRLTGTADPFGNQLRYIHRRDSGRDGPHLWDQLYIERIEYADYDADGSIRFLVSVEFDYQERPDPFSDHRAGFEIRTRLRCRSILVQTHAERTRRVRSYRLEYLDDLITAGEADPDLAPRNKVSLLSRVTVTGHDDEQEQATEREQRLPPLRFGYTRFEPQARRFAAVEGRSLPPTSLANRDLELVDLFGRGLPDILEVGAAARYWRNLGGGRFDLPRSIESAPAGIALSDPGVQLVDADGDGRADLLVTTPQFSGYFPLGFGAKWDPDIHRFAHPPSFNLEDPDVKLFDLDGDGVTDAIRSGARLECFFSDPKRGWIGTRFLERRPLEDFPDVSFADPRVRWADMTGDQLHDIVLVHDGSVEFWPNQGHGNWGRRVRMRNSPRFRLGYDPTRILLGDVDGDGLADVVYVDDGEVTLWVNQGGEAWSDPVTVRGTPPLSDLDSVRLVDLLGTGVGGVLWSADLVAPSRSNLFFLDFTGGSKPYLLNEMDNLMGAVTRVSYASSTRFCLQDDRSERTRWRTTLPFPVQVVAEVEIADALSQSTLVSEYRYRNGYWDGARREFRGFVMVELRDSQSFVDYAGGPGFDRAYYSAPTLTRTWFYPGPVGTGRGSWQDLDWSDEYWPGDPPKLRHREAIDAILASLPDPTARRDALRGLRGKVLRSELYATDGSDREDRPYTVSEYAYGLREESPPIAGQERPRVFFAWEAAQRVTQWERGDDPMTQFAFTADHDACGQPRRLTKIACPRGWRESEDRPGGDGTPGAPEPYLATRVLTNYAAPSDPAVYIQDRVAGRTSFEVTATAGKRVSDLATLPDDDASLRLFGQEVHRFDGPAFDGLPFGEVGAYGALVRSEGLVFTEDLLAAAYDTLPPYLAGNEPPVWTDEYPRSFRAGLPQRAGYVARDGAPYAPGLFAVTERRCYDFQNPAVDRARGLLLTIRDALGRDTTVGYDAPYGLLPVLVTDPVRLATRAAYDYRVLQPHRITDANGTATVLSFTPLGLPYQTWTRGNSGEGDQISASITLQYDFDAFARDRQPILVRSTRRLHHDADVGVPQTNRDATVVSVEYSDGFGRLLQTRAQAEDLRFGDPVSGEGVLPEDQSDGQATLQQVTGSVNVDQAAPNVIVSGWQRYDNKGRAVEKYEPFFSEGWTYARPNENSFGKKVVLYYDPRGNSIRTVNPDSSEQRVIYGIPIDLDDAPASSSQTTKFKPTAWEVYTYDANDNAGRTHGAEANTYQRHWNTPASIVVDGLGRPVLSVERYRAPRESAASPVSPVVEFRTRSHYDNRGNLLYTVDQLGREAFNYYYDLASRPLKVKSMDAGNRRTVLDAGGNAIEQRDGKGALILQAYDALNRRVALWARNSEAGDLTLREILAYGDTGDPQQPDAERQAQAQSYRLGRLTHHYDEAGLLTCAAYDFKGNLTEKSRRVIANEPIITAMNDTDPRPAKSFTVNWDVEDTSLTERKAELLEEVAHTTSVTHDALNRPYAIRFPEDVTAARKLLLPRYNCRGLLSGIVLVDGLKEETFVEHIAYNAKGKRTLIAYGNRVMTRYAYDPQTFRLIRLRTERFATLLADRSYRPLGRPLQDLAYTHDLIGNILDISERVRNCGVRNNPEAARYIASNPALSQELAAGHALIRHFEYDPLYRLVRANGRESKDIPMASQSWSGETWNPYLTGTRNPSDQNNGRDRTRCYTETYDYDPADNMLELGHSGSPTRSFGLANFTPQDWASKVGLFLLTGTPQDWGSGGNRLTHVVDGQTVPTITHRFDGSGNLEQELSNRYFAWDHANRLTGFADRAGTAASREAVYLYDASGMRLKKVVRAGGQVETTICIDAIFERVQNESTATTVESDLLRILDNDVCVATVRAGLPLPDDGAADIPVQYQFNDHLGSSSLIVGGRSASANAFISREEYFPYGRTSFGSFGRKCYRFSGKRLDRESGLCQQGVRYLATWLGRWISCDPVGPVDGLNSYRYARANPISLTDKLGMKSEEATSSAQLEITIDHIEARNGPLQGSSTDPANLQFITRSNNSSKGARIEANELCRRMGDG